METTTPTTYAPITGRMTNLRRKATDRHTSCLWIEVADGGATIRMTPASDYDGHSEIITWTNTVLMAADANELMADLAGVINRNGDASRDRKQVNGMLLTSPLRHHARALLAEKDVRPNSVEPPEVREYDDSSADTSEVERFSSVFSAANSGQPTWLALGLSRESRGGIQRRQEWTECASLEQAEKTVRQGFKESLLPTNDWLREGKDGQVLLFDGVEIVHFSERVEWGEIEQDSGDVVQMPGYVVTAMWRSWAWG